MNDKTKHDFLVFVTGTLEMNDTPLAQAVAITKHAHEIGLGEEMTLALVSVATRAHTMRRLKKRIEQTTSDMQELADLMLEIASI